MIDRRKPTPEELSEIYEKLYKMYNVKNRSDYEGSIAKYECIINNERNLFMKKKLIFTTAILTAISLSACGNTKADTETKSTVMESSEITESPEDSNENLYASTELTATNLTTTSNEENANIENLSTVTNSDRGNSTGEAVDNTQTSDSNGQLDFKADEIFEDEEYDIFKHAKEHCTFEYGPDETGEIKYGALKYATFTMDNELRAAISDLIPELNEYPEAFREEQLKNIARDISWLDAGDRLDTEKIREDIKYKLDIYYDAGYDKEYGPGPQQSTQAPSTQVTTPDNNTGSTGTTGGSTSQQLDENGWPVDTKWADNPTVTIDHGFLGTETFTHTGEYINGKAVYDNGYGHKYHITESGEMQYLPRDFTEEEKHISENGANLTDHLRQ